MKITVEAQTTDPSHEIETRMHAIGLAMADPKRVIGLTSQLDEALADLARAHLENDDLRAQAERLQAQLRTDETIMEGLREQLRMKDSPAPAPDTVHPPAPVEQASGDVLPPAAAAAAQDSGEPGQQRCGGEVVRPAPFYYTGGDLPPGAVAVEVLGTVARLVDAEGNDLCLLGDIFDPDTTDIVASAREQFKTKDSHDGHGAPGNKVVSAEVAATPNTGGNPGTPDVANDAGPQSNAQASAEDRPVAPDGQRGSAEGGPPTPAAAAKDNGMRLCARCKVVATRRTVPVNPTAPEYLKEYVGKPLCAECEVRLRKPQCKGTNKSTGTRCELRPLASGFCGHHEDQAPPPLPAVVTERAHG